LPSHFPAPFYDFDIYILLQYQIYLFSLFYYTTQTNFLELYLTIILENSLEKIKINKEPNKKTFQIKHYNRKATVTSTKGLFLYQHTVVQCINGIRTNWGHKFTLTQCPCVDYATKYQQIITNKRNKYGC
jgi:hypothetical protein